MNTDNATMSPTAGQSVLKMSKKGRYKLIWKRYKRNKLAMVGMVVFLVMLLAVFGAPLYIDYDQAITQHIVDAFTAPGGEHIFGTDQFGRDLFARVIYGGRISLGAGSLWRSSRRLGPASISCCFLWPSYKSPAARAQSARQL